MRDSFIQWVRGGRAASWPEVLGQAAAVCVLGLLVAVTANSILPTGLELSRDHFPQLPDRDAVAPSPSEVSRAENQDERNGVAGLSPSEVEGGSGAEKGLPTVTYAEMVTLLESTEFLEERVVFVDARSEEVFQEGHIPGAFVLDRFHPEQHLAEVLPVVLVAERVVVYCTGGDCEDSEYAALMLKESGVPDDRLGVYRGGMEDWTSRGGSVELGDRLSGDLR